MLPQPQFSPAQMAGIQPQFPPRRPGMPGMPPGVMPGAMPPMPQQQMTPMPQQPMPTPQAPPAIGWMGPNNQIMPEDPQNSYQAPPIDRKSNQETYGIPVPTQSTREVTPNNNQALSNNIAGISGRISDIDTNLTGIERGYHPSGMRKFGAALAGIGTGMMSMNPLIGLSAYQGVRDIPMHQKQQPLINERAGLADELKSAEEQQKIGIEGTKADAAVGQANNEGLRLQTDLYKAQNPGYDFPTTNGTVFKANKGTGQVDVGQTTQEWEKQADNVPDPHRPGRTVVRWANKHDMSQTVDVPQEAKDLFDELRIANGGDARKALEEGQKKYPDLFGRPNYGASNIDKNDNLKGANATGVANLVAEIEAGVRTIQDPKRKLEAIRRLLDAASRPEDARSRYATEAGKVLDSRYKKAAEKDNPFGNFENPDDTPQQ